MFESVTVVSDGPVFWNVTPPPTLKRRLFPNVSDTTRLRKQRLPPQYPQRVISQKKISSQIIATNHGKQRLTRCRSALPADGTCKECHKTKSLWNHTTTDHKEGEQLEDRRSVGTSSCNSGDGTDRRVQSLMFMVMMTISSCKRQPSFTLQSQIFQCLMLRHGGLCEVSKLARLNIWCNFQPSSNSVNIWYTAFRSNSVTVDAGIRDTWPRCALRRPKCARSLAEKRKTSKTQICVKVK